MISLFSVKTYENPYKSYLNNNLFDIVDDTLGIPMFVTVNGVDESPYLKNKMFDMNLRPYIGKTIQISVYVYDF